MWFRHFGKNGRCMLLFVCIVFPIFFVCTFTYLHNTIHGRIVQISGLLRSSCWSFDWEIWFNREAARVLQFALAIFKKCCSNFGALELCQERCKYCKTGCSAHIFCWPWCSCLSDFCFVLKHWYCFRCNQKMVYLAWQAWNHEVNFFVHLRLIFKQKPEKKSKTELKIKLPLT